MNKLTEQESVFQEDKGRGKVMLSLKFPEFGIVSLSNPRTHPKESQ